MVGTGSQGVWRWRGCLGGVEDRDANRWIIDNILPFFIPTFDNNAGENIPVHNLTHDLLNILVTILLKQMLNKSPVGETGRERLCEEIGL